MKDVTILGFTAEQIKDDLPLFKNGFCEVEQFNVESLDTEYILRKPFCGRPR